MAASGARVRIYGDWDGSAVKRAQQDLSTFQRQATGFSGAIGKSFLGMGAAIGGAFAIGSVISSVTNYLQDAATAAMQDEKSMVALAKAMDNVGQGFANASTEQFVSDLMLATGTADDLIRNGLQRLVVATGSAARAQELFTTALDISAATGRDVVTVSQALARASTGQVSALTRLGIPLDQNIVKTKDFGAALEVLNERFGGQAAAAADTYGGQLSRLQVAAGEAQETIGYALLDAVENVTDAFGGTGGFQEVILEAGEYAANLVAGIGQAVSALADLAAGAEDVQLGVGGASISLADLGKEAVLALPGIGAQLHALGALAESGEEYRLSQERVNQSLRASEALYAGYAASTDAASVAQRGMEMSAEQAEEAIKAVRDEVNALKGALATNQAVDDFAVSLRGLGETLKGNKDTLIGFSDAALENREALRKSFSDAAGIVQGFVDEGRISADQFAGVFAGTGRKIVDEFVKQGFTRKEIRAFLQAEGLWSSELAAIFAPSNNAKALGDSERLGYDIASGIAVGVTNGTPQVKTAMSGTVLSAIQSAKNAAKIKSPSEVTRDEIGLPIAQGIAEGVRAGGDDVRKAMQDNFLTAFSEVKEGLKKELNDAKAAFNDYRASVSQAIMGGIDFGAIAPEFDENGKRIGMSFIEALNAQAAQAQAFALKVKELVTLGLSQASLQQVLAAGVQAGTSIANELISGGATTISETNELVATTQAAADEVGLLAANSFYATGVKNAQDTYEGFKANFGQGGPAREALMKVMDNLAASMNRSATITVTTVNRQVNEVVGRFGGARALGGPVTAGKAYLVGERGPEVLVMGSQSGQIIPNGDLPMASGFARGGDGASMSAPVVINISAGMGTDGAEVGRQVVDALKAYSRRNGPLPLAVA